METIHALHAKISQLEKEIQVATQRTTDLDRKITSLEETHASNLEKQKLARVAIERNLKLIKENEIVAAKSQTKNEVQLHQFHILQKQMQSIANKVECAFTSFKAFSEKVGSSIKSILQDMKSHDFYDIDSDFVESLEKLRTEWKEHVIICAFYYRDEEDILRDNINQEMSKRTTLIDQLESCHNNIRILAMNDDDDAMSEKDEPINDKNGNLNDYLSNERNFHDKNDIIDVTGTYSAVIDLSKNTVIPATINDATESFSSTKSPWYHEFKRRKTNTTDDRNIPLRDYQRYPSQRTDIFSNNTESSFVSGWDMLNQKP